MTIELTEDGHVHVPSQYDQMLAAGNMMQLKRLEDHPVGESLIMMYYGASGSGKTYFGGTAGERTLFINIGMGIETLKAPAFTLRYPSAKRMIVKDVFEQMNEQGITEVATAFNIVTDTIDYALRVIPNEWDTCVLDDATFFRQATMNRALEINAALRTGEKKKEVDLDQFAVIDVGDYGREMQMIEWFLKTYKPRFKDNGKHFLMLAHERNIFGKSPKIGEPPPLLKTVAGFTGRTFPDVVPAFFDDVFHAEVVGGGSNAVYRARTAGDEISADLTVSTAGKMAKARHGGIFETVEPDPNFLTFLKRIKSGKPHPKFAAEIKRKYGTTV